MLFLYKLHAYWSVNAISVSLWAFFIFYLSGRVQIWGHPFIQAFWKQPAAFIQALSAVYLDCMCQFLFFDVNCFAGELAITDNAPCTFLDGPAFLHWVRPYQGFARRNEMPVRPAEVSWVTDDKWLPARKKTNRFETVQNELFLFFFFARNSIVHNSATGLVLQSQSQLLPC